MGAGGSQWQSGLDGRLSGFEFIAQQLNHFRRRADKNDFILTAKLGETAVFRQKPISGMDRIGAAFFGDGNNFFLHQIRFGRGDAVQRIGLIGGPHMVGRPIGIGVNRDRCNPGVAAGARDADGDFAPVGNQYFLYVDHIIFGPSSRGPLAGRGDLFLCRSGPCGT